MGKIIGIHGSKFSGKDTTANLIIKHCECDILHFADALKDCLNKVFFIDYKYLTDPSLKEVNFAHAIKIDKYIDKLSKYLNLNILPKHKVAKNARTLLQYVGTDYVKSVDDNYWINKVSQKINKDKITLIPDTRFEDEANFIKENNGFIITVESINSSFNKKSDNHASENGKINYDFKFINDFNDFNLLEKQVYSFVEKHLKG
jgi:hypothetical protein